MCVGVFVYVVCNRHTCHDTHLVARGQLWEVSSLFPPLRGFEWRDSGHQAWEPSTFSCWAILQTAAAIFHELLYPVKKATRSPCEPKYLCGCFQMNCFIVRSWEPGFSPRAALIAALTPGFSSLMFPVFALELPRQVHSQRVEVCVSSLRASIHLLYRWISYAYYSSA